MSGTWNSITHFQPKDIGGKNTIKDLEIGAAIATAGVGGLGLAGVDVLGGIGGAIGAGVDGLGSALGFGGAAADAGAAGAAGGLAPGSLDALAATGNLAGSVPAGASAAGFAAPAGAEAALGFAPDATSAAGSGGFNAIDAAAGQGAGLQGAAAGGNAFTPNAGIGAFATENVPAGGLQPLTTAGVQGAVNSGAAAPAATGNALQSFLGLTPGTGVGGSGISAGTALGGAAAAGGLGYSILNGQKQTGNEKALADQAAKSAALGNQLSGYLTSGTLPPGLQAGVTSAVQNAKAAAISNAAHNGQSTDPTQNTALAQQLAAIDAQTPALTAQIGQQLLQGGQAASGLSSQTYTTLANIDQTQTQAIGKAIANMAAALSGKSGMSTPAGSFTFSPGASS